MIGLSIGQSTEAASYRLIYEFTGAADGGNPFSGLVADSLGRLYGTTYFGGSLGGDGVVYRLTKPAGGGEWTEEVLHSFDYTDGALLASPVILGSSGEVYGMAASGGSSGFGDIFRLDNVPGWPITVLHSFGPRPDAEHPNNADQLAFGPDGLLYGVTFSGGSINPQGSGSGAGAAFSISPLGDAIEYAVIHDFGKGSDGYYPSGPVVSTSGRVFGVTQQGGVNGLGMAFALQKNASGIWQERKLTQFSAPGVSEPSSPPILGKGTFRQNLFGCGLGGLLQQGVVYQLSPDGASGWTQTVLYNFGSQLGDPSYFFIDECGLTQGSDGKLYGTTTLGGASGVGAFFEVDPPTPGSSIWTEKVIYSFPFNGEKGKSPIGAPLRQGNTFYGTVSTTSTGAGGVYQITP